MPAPRVRSSSTSKGDVPGVIGHFVIENGAYKEVGIVEP